MRNEYRILVGMLKERDRSEDLGVDGRIKLKWMLAITWCKGVNWVHLLQDRDR
jgi:hypothetical protein